MKNKLIAEFMGEVKTFDVVDNDTYRGEITLSKGLTEEQIEGEISHFEDRYSVTPIAIEEPLQYYDSWDWLKPVVDEIEQVHEGVPKQLLHLSLFSTRAEVYKAVVEFIEWCNQNKEDE
tara:strand:- start:1969 stop:2325 length:357 start_codon:yes stop_codon:yes gene_type:complete